MAIPRELFGRKILQNVYSQSTIANKSHHGKHHQTTVATNLKRLAASKGRTHLTISEAIQTETLRVGNFIVVIEGLIAAMKKHPVDVRLGKVKRMERVISSWEAMAKNRKLKCDRNKNRYKMYQLLKLKPKEIFEAELYMLSEKSKISNRSPITLQKNAIKIAITNTLRNF